jgi:hypothetical protein
LYRTISRLIGATVLALLVVGCGGPASSTDGSGTAKAFVPAPRPGEDVMKEQMLRLQQKGTLPKRLGIPKNK